MPGVRHPGIAGLLGGLPLPVNLTPRFIAGVDAPSSGRQAIADELVPGLQVRVTSRGAKTFAVWYRANGRPRLQTLGRFPLVSLAEARERARDILARVRQGKDPQGDKVKARGADDFTALARHFMEANGPRFREKTRQEYDRVVRKELVPALGKIPPAEIERAHVREMVRRITDRGATYMANRTLEITRQIFNWAIEEDLLESSPCFKLKKPGEEVQRDRVLSEDEIRAYWGALDQETGIIADAFRLMLLTAQRRGEVLTMRWQDIAGGSSGPWWTIPAASSKNRLAHRVPLDPQALAILEGLRSRTGEGVWVFPSPTGKGPIQNPQKAAERIRRCAGVEDARTHDLRRTAASHMASMGTPRFVIGRVLNHAERDVTAVYDRHSYDAEKRTALEAWGRKLESTVSGAEFDTSVVPFSRA